MKRFYFLFLFGLTFFLSCVEQISDHVVLKNSKLLELTLKIDTLSSKAIIYDETLPNGSYVGVSLTDNGNTYEEQDYSNVRYEVNNGMLQEPDQEILLSKTPGVLSAYYPYVEGGNIASLSISTSTQCDYMYASSINDIDEDNRVVSLVMNHAMSVLSLNLVKGTYKGQCAVTGIGIESAGLATEAVLDARVGTISQRSNMGEIISVNNNFILNTSGIGTDILLIPADESSDATISVFVDGSIYVATLSDFKPEAGKRYFITATLNNSELILSDFYFSSWNNKVHISGNTDDIAINQTVNSDGSVVISAVSMVAGEKVNAITFTGNGIVTQELNDEGLRIITVSNLSGDVYLSFDGITSSSLNCIVNPSVSGIVQIFGDDADLSDVDVLTIDGVEYSVAKSVSLTPGEHVIKVYFKDGVTEIPAGFFHNVTFTSVSIPDYIVSIGNDAFLDCISLSSVDFANVTTIGDNAFNGCSKLESIDLVGVKSIGNYAFYSSALLNIDLSTVVSLGTYAFSKCNLISLSIPSTIESIGAYAFQGCDKLSNVVLRPGLTFLSHFMFNSCKSITSITIPSTVQSMDNGVFSNCTGLSTVSIEYGVKQISTSAFKNCSNLKEVTIPSTVIYIHEDAFYNCGFSSITIPEGVIKLGGGAFRNCSNLKEVTIPSTVTHVGFNVFYDCVLLSKITCLPTTPPSIDVPSQSVLVNNATVLSVPMSSYGLYLDWISDSEYISLIGFI